MKYDGIYEKNELKNWFIVIRVIMISGLIALLLRVLLK
jgi:hypothetical protein